MPATAVGIPVPWRAAQVKQQEWPSNGYTSHPDPH